VPFIEMTPAIVLLYVCVKWIAAKDGDVPIAGVVAAVGGSWTGYQFWKFSRYRSAEPRQCIYCLRWRTVRGFLVAVLYLSFGLSAVLYVEASLSLAYLLSSGAMSAGFVALVWPRATDDREPPAWAGLSFSAGALGLVLVQLVALA
jgi:hypothetical protein